MNENLDTADASKRATGIRVSDDAGDARVVRRHGFGTRTEENQPLGQFVPAGKFGRMFPEIPPLMPSLASLDELGAAMLDTRPHDNPADHTGDNPYVPAGFTYLGQFIDHDITFDTTALQEVIVDPLALRNFRTPMLDLDSIYGSGPVAQPYLYDRADPDKLLIGRTNSNPGGGDATVPTELPHDLARAPNGFALIGDPRNDENLIVAQTHLAFLRFHNKVVDWLREDPKRREAPIRKTIFEEARDTVIWHYQWVVVHDFLRRLLDEKQLDTVLEGKGKRFYHLDEGQDAFIPVEFSVAAYRFGHTMVRDLYDYNRVFTPLPGGVTPASLGLIFRFSGLSGGGGGVPIPSDWIIDWRRFYELGGATAHGFSRRLDPFLAPTLQNLPGVPPPKSLAVRNLRRGRSLGLPPGQSVAKFMGFDPLKPADIAQGPDGAVAKKHNLHIETPLWYYILKEAELQGKGVRLGPVGSRIVAEVFIGLLRADIGSYLSRKPNWKPRLPAAKKGSFTMVDLINFMGEINPIGNAPAPQPQ
jgi:hypothetical protein